MIGGDPNTGTVNQGGQLPSGRHGLPRKYVVDNQRLRILRGVMQAVALTGYSAATVGDIVTAARLSRRTFYEHFEGKHDCFLAAYDAAVESAANATREIARSGESFPDQVRLVLEQLVRTVVAEPEIARACLVEVVAGGEAALQRRDEALRLFASILREQGESQLPDGVRVPPLAAELVVSGLCEVVNARLVQDRADELEAELAQMVYCALAPYCGHHRAQAAAQAAAA